MNTTTEKRVVQKMVPFIQITIGKSNPRKVFDEGDITELTESIKAAGVIQAVLLRFTKVENVYELVCGERRIRASKAAGLTEIPAVIREMTDEEALEAQITENLQRKDVHPLEEASAFKQMLEHHSLVEVAARVGKKDYFVKQRLKLNDLTTEWQKIFYRNVITIADALKLAVLPIAHQETILKEEGVNKKNIAEVTRIQISDYQINKFKGQLAKACFDLADATLDKKAGACSACQYNSAVASLFPGTNMTPSCTNISCFKHKTDLFFDKELKKVLEDPTVVLITTSYGDSNIITKLRKDGHNILKQYNDFRWGGNEPDMPIWDELVEDYDADDYDGKPAEEVFAEEMKTYEEAKKRYDKQISGGKFVKAFCVAGDEIGQYKYVELTKKSSGSKDDTKSARGRVESGKGSAVDIDSEIARLRDNEKRAKELDGEKVHKLIVAAMGEDKALKTLPTAFTDVDWGMLCFLLAEDINYSSRDLIKKVVGISMGSWATEKREKLLEQLKLITDAQAAFIVRTLIFQKFNTHGPSGNGGYMVRALAELVGTIPIDQLELEQQERATKRQERVNKRIADLQAQKKELGGKTTEKKPATKKAAAKK